MFESEERRIVRRIKDYIKDEEPSDYVYIMLRNRRILVFNEYHVMVESGKINPKDAYVYIRTNGAIHKADFYYPFLVLEFYEDLLNAYLSKLGLYFVPATGLKYVADAVGLHYRGYLSVEVVNLDTVANNTNLPKIMLDVLDGKLVSGEKKLTGEEYIEIRDMFSSQRLFAGHDVGKAWGIIYDYYDEGNQSLANEAARIAMEYYRIFQPYTVCYDMKTWKEVDCWSIKL